MTLNEMARLEAGAKVRGSIGPPTSPALDLHPEWRVCCVVQPPAAIALTSTLSGVLAPLQVMDVLASVKDLWEVKAAFARTTHTPLKARYEAGEITAEQLAAESSRAREAVLKGHMVSELARTRGQEEAERVVEGMWARYREKLAAAPQEEIPGSRFMYVYLERTAAPMP